MTKILLVDTTTRFLNVAAYAVTKDRHNQLVLRHAGNLGSLLKLQEISCGDFYVAVTEKKYQARSSEGHTEAFLPGETKQFTVAAKLEGGCWDKRPFLLDVFKNRTRLYKPVQASGLSWVITQTTKEIARMKSLQGHLVVGEGQSNYFRYAEFIPQKNSSLPNVADIPEEYNENLHNSQPVYWLWKDARQYYYRASDIVEFSPAWRENMLAKLADIKYDNALLPTASGEWAETMMYIGSGYYSVCMPEGIVTLPAEKLNPLQKEWQQHRNEWMCCADKEFWFWALPRLVLPCRAVYNKAIYGELVA